MVRPPTIWTLGQSTGGRPLEATVFAPGQMEAPPPSTVEKLPFPWLLLLGGVHGDEIEGVWLIEAALENWKAAYPGESVGAVLWPRVNPDGVETKARWNARQVDLNRNLPSKDWTAEVKNPRYPPGPSPASEPENQALVRLITEGKPTAILSAHSFHKYQINVNGPSHAWGERLSRVCGYPVTHDIGYPTPGCLGTYAGKELGIPTITLEIERGLPREKVLSLHLDVISASLDFWSKEEIR